MIKLLSIFFRNKELYIISALNENAIILAKSIKRKNSNALIIFTDASEADKSCIKSAKSFGCIVTDECITNYSLLFHNKRITTHFILMSYDENNNLDNVLKLTELYRDKINAEIYTFNSSKESECLCDSIYKGSLSGEISPIKLRRVNAIRNQIYCNLLKYSIYDEAVEEYNEKVISVLIVGMGKYGLEMIKAILWCGQMDGYVLRIHIIDKCSDIETIFYKECPGIRQRGTQPKSGEDYYELFFHPGIDVNTEDFNKTVCGISDTTFAFVSLGNEQTNIETAMNLRSIFSGLKIDAGLKPEHSRNITQTPRITAVVHTNEKAELLNNNLLSNFKQQYFQIDCIGANSKLYSYENIFMSELEKMALTVHMQWGQKEDFDNYEYNRRSSMTSAIHKKYRDELMPDDETKDILEHKRWNAYMRSTEGYSFGLIRDDLAHRHPLLVKYDHLSRFEKDKDKRMNFPSNETVF